MTRVLATDPAGTDPAFPERTLPPSAGPTGTARSALRHRDFRLLLTGTFLSSIGSWMQNIVIGPYALALTVSRKHPHGSASFAGTIVLAQMGPVLLFAVIGGVLANRYPRRPILLLSQTTQMISALGLALMVLYHPTKLGLFVGVLVGGVAAALGNPAYQAILPSLVPREDLSGMVALNSAQINGSRVIGPLLMVALAPIGIRADTNHGIAAAFVINAVTFLFAMFAILRVAIGPTPSRREGDAEGISEMLSGYRAARRDPVAGRLLVLLFLFTAFCLPFVSHFPTMSERIFNVKSHSTTYTWLYGTWAFGAMVGALSMGTVLSHVDKRKMIRFCFLGFACALGIFANVSTRWIVFAVAFCLGAAYFGTTTAMATVMQQHLRDRDRAPIMALWFMAFGGTVPIGAKVGGALMDKWSVTGTLMIGAGVAVVLAALARFDPTHVDAKLSKAAKHPV